MVVRQVVEIHRTWRDSLTPSGSGRRCLRRSQYPDGRAWASRRWSRVALGGTAGEPGPLREWKYAHMVPGHDPVGAMTAPLRTRRADRSDRSVDSGHRQYEELITLHSYDGRSSPERYGLR